MGSYIIINNIKITIKIIFKLLKHFIRLVIIIHDQTSCQSNLSVHESSRGFKIKPKIGRCYVIMV